MAESDKNVIGIAMNLDVTDLKSGLAEVNKEIKKSKDDFAAVTSSMDNWQKSTDGLTAKIKQLDTQLAAQTKAVAGYKAEIERVSKLEGDHTATLDRLRAKLKSTEQSFNVTAGQVKRYEASLAALQKQNITNSIKTAQSALSKFGNELKKVTKAQLAQNVAMLANPYAIAAAGVGFLIGKVTQYIQKKKEESAAQRQSIEEVKELKKEYADYGAVLNSALSAVTQQAKSYSDSIQQTINLRESIAKLKKEWSDTSSINNYLGLLAEHNAFMEEVKKRYGENSEAYKEGQEAYRSLLTDLVLLNAKLLESGKTEQEIKKVMEDIGVATKDAAAAFQIAKKGVEDFSNVNNKAANDKPVEFYSTTQFAEDKKHYEEWAKLREAREYKLATLDGDLTEAERVRAVAAIDDEMAKHNDYVKRYLEAQMRMKLAAEETTEDAVTGQEKVAANAETAADKFMKAWTGKLDNVGVSAQQIFNSVGNVASQAADTAKTIIDSVSEYWDNYYNEQLAALEEEESAETEKRKHDLSEIERQYMNYEITLDDFKSKKAQIEADITSDEAAAEDERNKKKEAIEREQDARKKSIFEANKAVTIAQLWIDSAVGQVTAFVNAIRDLGFPAGPIVGGITAGLVLASTIAQTVAVASQQYQSAFAKGGIVDRPTIGLVGEAGREAIMPLENNTEWITELARKISIIQRTDLSAGMSTANNYSYGGDTFNNQRESYYYTQNIYAPKTPSRLDLYRDGKRLLSISKGGRR